jgi:antitoxin component of MazEF toxin-antitoxin module
MQTVIRKLGNSAGLIVPASIMKDLGLNIDQNVDMSAVDGCLVIKPLGRPRYKLSDLLAEMEGDFPQVEGWDNMPSVGKELAL